MVIATNDQVSYSWRLAGKDYRIERVSKPLSELRFDPKNQRIQFSLRAGGLDPLKVDNDTVLKALMVVEKKHIDDLYWAIYEARGILDPLIVTDDGLVLEGNCRLAALLKLCDDYPNPEFCSPPCEVLPNEFDEEARLLYLGDCHVAGKQKWDAYEQADHVNKMTQIGKSQEFIAKFLRMSKTTVIRYVDAFQMHNEFLRINPDPANVHKWSYFYELEKKKVLRERAHADSAFKERFFRWIAKGKITGMQVRELTALIDDDDALKALDNHSLAEAIKVHASRDGGADHATETFPTLDLAIRQLEEMPAKELERLSSPDSVGAARLRELYQRLHSVAKLAGFELTQV